MEPEEFRAFGTAMLDYIVNYLENIRNRRVLPTVEPGYIRDLLPTEAPLEGEKWQAIMSDIERVIMPGITHWHSPQFHAFYPTANSYPAIVADMLSGGIACIGFTWMSSPACTELEVVMLDWLGQMLQLPPQFLHSGSDGKGGGVIQGTASEATLVALLSIKAKTLRKYKDLPDYEEAYYTSKFVGYLSDEAHCSVERAGLLGAVKLRKVKSDENQSMRGAALKQAIAEDRAKGLIPIYVVATLGTTNSCAFDNLAEIGEVCEQEGDIWLHVDAAYAGSSFICEEFRPYLNGVEKAQSFNFNPHKWMNVNFDCSTMWVTSANDIVNAFNVDPLYLKHDMQGKAPDYRHWHIPLGRRFRSLKLWFVLRSYGVKKLQEGIRTHVRLAHEFEAMVKTDDRFEIFSKVILGLVCFRLKAVGQDVNENLLKKINSRGKIHMVAAKVGEDYVLRFAVCSRYTNSDDIVLAWNEILEATKETLSEVHLVNSK